MRMARVLAAVCLTVVAACSDDSTTGGSDSGGPEADVAGDVTVEVIADGDDADAVGDGFVPTVEDFGEACESNADCDSGWCVEGPAGSICTQLCTEACPDGTSCKAVVSASSATVFLCLPNNLELCSQCAEDAHCGTAGACLTLDGEGRCSFPCETAAECPDKHECVPDPSGARPGSWCVPDTGSCTCNAFVNAGVRTCITENSEGRCFGIEVCKGGSGWLPCTAPEPAAESCDGLDNDCNGLIDDQLAEGEACLNDVDGVGACDGVTLCLGGEGWICQGPTPVPEVCDVQDNDCDGATDEDFKDASGAWTLDEHCGYCNNACADKIPNATAVCGGSPEAPVCVVDTCDPGFVKFNAFQCLPPVDVTCAACTSDTDCLGGTCTTLAGDPDTPVCVMPCKASGEACPSGFECTEVAPGVDRCTPVAQTCSCTPATDGQTRSCSVSNDDGTCYGVETCDGAMGWSGCTAGTPAAELCDGLDNDCDGVIDDDLASAGATCENAVAGVGSCEGTQVCLGADGWLCQGPAPAVETCNFQDDDCDGATDEDFKDASGNWTLEGNCGGCGNTCADKIVNGTGTCGGDPDSPVCVVASCDPGFVQVGPFQCAPPTDVTCSPCTDDTECKGGTCLDIDGQQVCASPCSPIDGSCNPGYACTDVGGGVERCMPLTGSCTCGPTTDGLQRACTISNAEGSCPGLQTCDGALGWSDCAGPTPEAEVCDGADNDCNGVVDDGLALGQPCDITVAGVGTCVGNTVCLGAAGESCQGQTPQLETCNFLDDDCDGASDEDFKDAEGHYTLDEHCGTCGNACGAKFANGTGACGGSPDSPLCVVASCDADYFQLNDFQCVLPPDVSCQPCASDSDCYAGSCVPLDGQDVCVMPCGASAGACAPGYECVEVGGAGGPERCVPITGSCVCGPSTDGQTRTCSASNAFGTCFGQQICDGAAGWSGCSAATPAAETCNGADDDCNGAVDDGVTPPSTPCEVDNAFGTCTGSWFCSDPGGGVTWTCSAATPAQDVCDYLDNDCSGVADDPFKNGSGQYVSNEHCGACGVSCAGAIPNATAACSTAVGVPRCEVASCDPGFYQAGPLTCLPVSEDLCAACDTDANCPTPGDSCVTLGEGKFCGRDCGAGNLHGAPAGDCPSGYACTDVGGGDMQCVPASGACSCLPANDGATRPCAVSNAVGTCYGAETCDASAGWVGCTAGTPAAETCNGADDDCNALVDDLPGRGDACAITNGFGSCDGVMDCAGGQASLQCVGPTPSQEVCNLADDDCDGAVDEGFPDVGQGCTAGDGVCEKPGIRVCTADGSGTECSATPGSPDPGGEVCDGLDNDCDGTVDDVPSAPLCAKQLGVCAGATQLCAGAKGFLACDAGRYGADFEPVEISCDGLDNDCDGATDEVDVDGDGEFPVACGGTDCDDLNPLVGQFSPETCGDGLDNDCNGGVDDKDEDGDLHIDAACAAYVGVLPVDDCLDGVAAANPDEEEICGDGLDNDCDGSVDNRDIDGDDFIAQACGGPDCDDTEATVKPGALEICDGLDNGCNGVVDDKDLDVDGHVDAACVAYPGALPIDDCDDANVGVNPDMDEVCGNALDEDCSGAVDDKDVDEDGAVDTDPLCGGDDCDDNDPMIYPGAPEVRDGKDNDCDADGKADEGLIVPGDLIVTEVFYDSSQTPDENFEWFEVFNPTDRPVNMQRWLLRDMPASSQEIAVVGDPVVVAPRRFATLCRTGDPVYNGGVVCDYEYGFMQLANSADELYLDFDGVIVDAVEYDESPWPAATNASLNLDPDALLGDNNDPNSWCAHPPTPTIPNGDPGTPGAGNVDCSGSPDDPKISAVDPTDGVTGGGTVLTILGAGFSGTSGVAVGGASCDSYTVVSDHEITCVVPAGSAGYSDVQVTEGAASDALSGWFRYTATASSAGELVASSLLEGPGEASFVRDTWSQALRATVTEGGVTGGGCPAAGEYAPGTLQAQVGYGPAGSDPRSEGAWRWFPAFCEAAVGSADRFKGTVFVDTPGSYRATLRFSVDGGATWNYADLTGSGDGFSAGQLTTLTVL